VFRKWCVIMSGGIDVVKVMDALANENRVRILKLLSDGKPRTVSEIAKELGLSRTATFYHLTILSDVGFVEQEYKIIKEPSSPARVGSFYRINKEKIKTIYSEIRKLLETLGT